MHARRLEWLVALVVCSCAASGGRGAGSGSAPGPAAVNPAPASDPGNATPASDKSLLANVGLECELTKRDGMCNQAKPKSMS